MFYLSKELQSVRASSHYRNQALRFLRRSFQNNVSQPAELSHIQVLASALQKTEASVQLQPELTYGNSSELDHALDYEFARYLTSYPVGVGDFQTRLQAVLESWHDVEPNQSLNLADQSIVPDSFQYSTHLRASGQQSKKENIYFPLRPSTEAKASSDDAVDSTFVLSKTDHVLISKEYIFEPEILTILNIEENFEVIKCIGYGAHGCVFEVRHRWDDKSYALKVMSLSDTTIKNICKEFKALSTLRAQNNSNIVSYYSSWIVNSSYSNDSGVDDSFIDCWSSSSLDSDDDALEAEDGLPRALRASTYGEGRTLIMKTELCTVKGTGSITLRQWLNQRKYLSWEESLPILKDIINGLVSVHHCGFIHRDLKPENVLLTTDVNGVVRAKICDFGLVALHMSPHQEVEPSKIPNGSLTAGVGTAIYSAPEQLESSSYDQSSDIYSFGMLFVEMLLPKFSTGMERVKVLSEVRNGNLDSLDFQIPGHKKNYVMSLVHACLRQNKDYRPCVRDIKAVLTNIG